MTIAAYLRRKLWLALALGIIGLLVMLAALIWGDRPTTARGRPTVPAGLFIMGLAVFAWWRLTCPRCQRGPNGLGKLAILLMWPRPIFCSQCGVSFDEPYDGQQKTP
jgi:hypothetical protein